MKLRKIISFKQHEKYMLDFLNDKALVPDASALIKELLRMYIGQVTGKGTSEDMLFGNIISSQNPRVYEDMLQNLKNKQSAATPYTQKDTTEHIESKGTTEDLKIEEQKSQNDSVSLQKNDPKQDVVRITTKENKTNEDMLRGLDL